MVSLPTQYELLRVAETASKDEIDATYYRRIRDFHPDLNRGDRRWLKHINEAHDVLSDERTREAYDQKLAEERERTIMEEVFPSPPPVSKANALTDKPRGQGSNALPTTPRRRQDPPVEPATPRPEWRLPYDVAADPELRENWRALQRWVESRDPVTGERPPLFVQRGHVEKHVVEPTAPSAPAPGPVIPTPVCESPTVLEVLERALMLFVPIALVVGIIALSSGGKAQSVSIAQAAVKAPLQTATKRQIAAERRIARLSLMCIDRYVCANDPDGHPVPIFVSGMDENLRTYLQKQGYKDEWTDSGGQIHGQTIGPNSEPEGEFAYSYVASAKEVSGPANENEPTNVETGMVYQDNREASGITPSGISGSMLWTVTWKLINPSGQTVKTLSYSVQLADCEGTGERYCEKAIHYEEEAPPGESVVYGGSYSATHYTPPSAFEKPREEQGE
jgi:hypothetical protein